MSGFTWLLVTVASLQLSLARILLVLREGSFLSAKRRRIASCTIASLLATRPLDLVQLVESGISEGPCALCL